MSNSFHGNFVALKLLFDIVFYKSSLSELQNRQTRSNLKERNLKVGSSGKACIILPTALFGNKKYYSGDHR
jgi:hypothetical protein